MWYFTSKTHKKNKQKTKNKKSTSHLQAISMELMTCTRSLILVSSGPVIVGKLR